MKVINDGKCINVVADFEEMAKIVQVLDKYWLSNDDENIKKLAYQLHNPRIKKRYSPSN